MDVISRIGLFLEVAKQESFAGAARQLGMTGPALSKQVQALEDQLGVRLLNRTTRHVSLTEEGAIYAERARKALEDLAEAERQIQERRECPTGILRVGVPMSFGLQYLTVPIADFARRYPDVAVEVDFDDRHVDVMAEGYDVVVRIGALEDSSLIARKLADCPIILCASPALIERHGVPNVPADLSTYPAILYHKHGQVSEWRYVDSHGKAGTVALQRRFAANNAEMMREACVQGIGLALLPIFSVADALQSGALVHLLPDYRTWPERGIYAVFPQNRHLSARVRVFVDWLTACADDFPWSVRTIRSAGQSITPLGVGE